MVQTVEIAIEVEADSHEAAAHKGAGYLYGMMQRGEPVTVRVRSGGAATEHDLIAEVRGGGLAGPAVDATSAPRAGKGIIIVVLDGGLVQEVSGIPAGYVVEVRDFDTDGRPEDDDMGMTEEGEQYFISEYDSEE